LIAIEHAVALGAPLNSGVISLVSQVENVKPSSRVAGRKPIPAAMSLTTSPKRNSLDLIQRMRDDASYEEIMYELNFLQKVDRGAKDLAEGRTATHEEVGQDLAKWLDDKDG
jgi:hypothetical protein